MSARRAGFTLIEMVAVMSIAGTVLALSTGIMVMTLRSERKMDESRQHLSRCRALAEQLREDVHRTPPGGIRLEEAGQLLVLQGKAAEGEAKIEYRATPQVVQRVEISEAGEITRREAYRCFGESEANWEILAEERLLQLRIVALPVPPGGSREQSAVFPVIVGMGAWLPDGGSGQTARNTGGNMQ
ncbi:MAG: type II secretion system protein [Planctomycetaceae bacterium]|nr:type II secretion system protein [Planctomycetaceae bacterium]